MSRAELEHVLARGLEGKKIRLKNNKLRLSAALHRAIHNSISQNGLAGYLRQCTHRATGARLPRSGRITANPDGTRKSGYVRVGDNPTGTRSNALLHGLMSVLA
jgi:outer membrane receptor for monomeric catechols